jgi:hypothetical protein
MATEKQVRSALMLRVVGIGEPLRDNALKAGFDHGPVQRPPVADHAVAIQLSARLPIRASAALRCRSGNERRSSPSVIRISKAM